MKTINALALVSILSLSSLTQAQTLGANVKISAKESLILRQVNSKTFKKVSSSVKGIRETRLILGIMGEPIVERLDTVDTNQDLTLSIQSYDSVRIVDLQNQVDDVVKADIGRSLFLNVKSTKIHSDDYVRLYGEALENQFKKTIRIRGKEISVLKSKTSLETSDLKCQRKDDKTLSCEQTINLDISVGI